MITRSAWIRPFAALALALAAPLAWGQAAPPPASGTAAPLPAEATAHFEMGTRHYNLQEWAAAVKEYKEAYRLAPRPETLWSIAQSQRLGGDLDAAILTYQSFLRTNPSERQAAMANEAIVKCQAALLDKRKADPAPPPGESAKAAIAPALVGSGAPSGTGVLTAPVPSETPAPPAPPRWYTDVLGDVLFLGGAAGVVLGGVLLGMGNAKAGDANAAADYATFDKARAGGPPLQTAGVAGLAVGGALLASGVVRFILVAGRRAPEPAPRDARRSTPGALRPSPARGSSLEASAGVGVADSSVVLRVAGQF